MFSLYLRTYIKFNQLECWFQNSNTEQPISSRDILKCCAHDQWENSHWLQSSREIRKRGLSIKSVDSGYRDLEIKIKGIQYKSFQLRSVKQNIHFTLNAQTVLYGGADRVLRNRNRYWSRRTKIQASFFDELFLKGETG